MSASSDGGISRRRVLSTMGIGAAAAATAAGLASGSAASAASTGDDPNTMGGSGGSLDNVATEFVEAAVATVPGLTYFSLNYADFLPYNNTTTKLISPNVGAYQTGGILIGSLDLPHGSTIVDMTIWGGAGGRVQVVRATLGTYLWETVLDATLPAGAGIQTAVDQATAPIRVDRSQASYHATIFPTTAASAILDIRIGYIGSSSFIPITPTRVYDSRESQGRLHSGTNRHVSVANAIASFGGAQNVVPEGATAIAYNLTVADTADTGFLGVFNVGGSLTASAINWFGRGQLLANAGIVKLGSNRDVTVLCGGGGSTEFIIDVTGYFP